MTSSVMAIIPARSGSKSIKDKNLAMLGGYPLLAYSVVAAKLSRRIDRVMLSTDSEQYAEVGRRFGAEVPFLRPAEISTDKSTDLEFMVHAMQWVQEHSEDVPEFWVHLRPTTPLRDPAHLDAAVAMLEGRPEATALRSAHPSPESPFKWFRRGDSGYLIALTSDDTNLDRFNMPRQAFPTVFIPDGYVDIVRSSFVLGTSLLHGDRVIGFESPHCSEVDSAEELELLDFQLRKFGSPLQDYLKSHWKP
ncbi:MAG: acylneuraminate cytidylyltransferase family protein [Betaproteobacteria bacterium]|nr:acylneuraminate cytidylyltransferase family protein [Betaproteobacteria bacterium]